MENKKDEEIRIVTFDGTDQFDSNGLAVVSTTLSDALAEISADRRFKVLVILSSGDMDLLPENRLSGAGGFDRIDAYVNVIESISALDIPTLIGLDGHVLGPVLQLALACDIRFATPASCFGFREITAGGMPCYGGTQRLSRLVGKGKALEMILTGELIDSTTAHQINLVNRVLDGDAIRSETIRIAREMATRSTTSLAYIKEAIHKGMDLTLEQGLRLEADLYYLIHTTDDRREGITAFKEKRTPVFGGR